MTTPRAGRLAVLILTAAAGIGLLAGCTPSPEPSRSASPSIAPSATATETAPALALVPEGTADDNLPYFRSIVDAVSAGAEPVAGRAYIDALTAGGFDKTAMQVTADQSTVGNAAESIQFSVRWGDDCLIGQVGPATGGALAVVEPGLPGGGCLLGQTRPIDW